MKSVKSAKLIDDVAAFRQSCSAQINAMVAVIGLFFVALLPLALTSARIVWLNRATILSTTSDSDASASGSLTAAKEAASRVAFATQFGAISIGWFFFCIGASPWVLPYEVWPIQFFSIMPMWPLGGALMLLSVRPTDKVATIVATPCVQLATLWFGTILLGAFFSFLGQEDGPPIPTVAPILLIGVTDIACSIVLLRNYLACDGCMKAGAPRVRLNRLWRSLRVFYGVMFVFFFFIGVANAGLLPSPPASNASSTANTSSAHGSSAPVVNPNDPHNTRGGDFTNVNADSGPDSANPADAPGAFLCALTCILLSVGLKPAVRRRFHSFLGNLAARGEAKAAATVAGLVGGKSPAEALKHGSSTFRGLPYRALSVDDFKTNSDTGLHQKTVQVDAATRLSTLASPWPHLGLTLASPWPHLGLALASPWPRIGLA